MINEHEQCDWTGWALCREHFGLNLIIKKPEVDGKYLVRVYSEAGLKECESQFSVVPKNWGQEYNTCVSNWEKDFWDGWIDWQDVCSWKMKEDCPKCNRILNEYEQKNNVCDACYES